MIVYQFYFADDHSVDNIDTGSSKLALWCSYHVLSIIKLTVWTVCCMHGRLHNELWQKSKLWSAPFSLFCFQFHGKFPGTSTTRNYLASICSAIGIKKARSWTANDKLATICWSPVCLQHHLSWLSKAHARSIDSILEPSYYIFVLYHKDLHVKMLGASPFD